MGFQLLSPGVGRGQIAILFKLGKELPPWGKAVFAHIRHPDVQKALSGQIEQQRNIGHGFPVRNPGIRAVKPDIIL